MSDKLQQAIVLIKSGDKQNGERLLAEVLKADPGNEAAWLWMSGVVANDEQRLYWLGQLAARYRQDSDPREILNYEMLIDTLTPELVRAAAERYLNFENYIQVSLLPEGGDR